VRADAVGSTGWPIVRWGRKLRPTRCAASPVGDGDDRVRTSLAAASGAQRAAVTDARARRARRRGQRAAGRLARQPARGSSTSVSGRCPTRSTAPSPGTDLGVQRRARWWGAVGALQWLLLLVALVGAGWLLALVGLGLLRLDDVLPLPEVGGIPLPTLLLVAGPAGRRAARRRHAPFVRAGARRRGRRAAGRLRDRIEQVAEAEVLQPVGEVLAARERFCDAVRRAGAT
jgi:hypothetical protein